MNISPTIAYFDFDDTLIPGDSILYWKRFYLKKKPYKRYFQIFTWLGLLGYLLGLIDSKSLKLIFLLPVSYISNKRELDSLAKKFVIEELKPRLYPEMVKKVREHEKKGDQVVIISASATFYLKYLVQLFPNAIIIGTSIEFPTKGIFRFPRYGKKWGNIKGITKVNYIKEDINLSKSGIGCFAYSDGYTDRFLLEFTEFSFAVQPDAKMEQIAREKKWPILQLFFTQSRKRRNFEKLKIMISDCGSWPQPKLFNKVT